MPALANTPVLLPRRVPPGKTGTLAGAGSLFPILPMIRRAPTIPRLNAPESDNSDNIERLAHDARNLMSGLMLYCELLGTPGVLNGQHGHYAQDLQTIVGCANRLLEKIVQSAISGRQTPPPASSARFPSVPVTDAAEELRRMKPLLAAIAGPATMLNFTMRPCAGQTALAVEDFTRIMVNLVRNAADAMHTGGHIRITAQYADRMSSLEGAHASSHVLLSVTDDGPGIPESLRARIFEPGFTTRKSAGRAAARRRGLGLSIVRKLVESAGGTVEGLPAPIHGTRFEILLPLIEVTSGTCTPRHAGNFAADGREKGCIECR